MAIPDSVKNSKEYGSIFNQIIPHWKDNKATSDVLDKLGSQFSNLFENNVGRPPTDAEFAKMFGELGPQILSSQSGFAGINSDAQGTRNLLAQYIGDAFQGAAQETAQQKTRDLASQYGSLADQYLEMGKKSLGNLSDELKTYSTSLFEKLRPQLNLAAQAGGYADSGGQTLQEQGALKDLADQGRGKLADSAYDIETNANNIRYGGAAAPVSMASTFAANTPYAVANLGEGGTNFRNANTMADYDVERQLRLMNANRLNNELFSENASPSFGRTLSQSFANNFGKAASDWFNPATYAESSKKAATAGA